MGLVQKARRGPGSGFEAISPERSLFYLGKVKLQGKYMRVERLGKATHIGERIVHSKCADFEASSYSGEYAEDLFATGIGHPL